MEDEAHLVLTSRQALTLKAVLNSLVPPVDDLPGAGDLGLVSYVDKAMGDAPHLRRHILGLLDQLEIDCRQGRQQDFSDLTGPDKADILRRCEGSQPESFNSMVQAAYVGYYSHPGILDALRAAAPSELESHLIPFDPQLLENVVNRGPMYTDV